MDVIAGSEKKFPLKTSCLQKGLGGEILEL